MPTPSRLARSPPRPRLAERVRDGEVTPPELAGGTFTVSNLGMFGIDRFEGIINAPQAAILCVGAIAAPVVASTGRPLRPMMSMTLACDHRILYGADAAEFLSELRRILQEPLAILSRRTSGAELGGHGSLGPVSGLPQLPLISGFTQGCVTCVR